MVRIGKCVCGGEFSIASYSRQEPFATAVCNRCLKEVRCVMQGKDRFYKREKVEDNASGLGNSIPRNTKDVAYP